MKNWIKKQIYNKTFTKGFLLFVILLLGNSAFAKLAYEKKKTVTKELAVSESQTLAVSHTRGDIEVIYYEGDKVKLEIDLFVKGEDQEDLETLIDQFSLDVSENSDGMSVNSSFNITTWSESSILNIWQKFKIKFKDGSSIDSKVKIVESSLKLLVPKVKNLTLENSYNNIRVESYPYDLEAKVFSGNFYAKKIGGELKLELRYGDAEIEDLKTANVEVFTGKVNIGNAKTLTIDSKYAEVKILNVDTIDLEIFEGSIQLGDVSSTFDIEGKYAKIVGGKIAKGDWELFECDVELVSIQELKLNEKYGNYKINTVGELNMESFEGDYDLKVVNSILSDENKYTKFKIDQLGKLIHSKESFEEQLKIKKLGGDFEKIDINGKYGKLDLELPSEYRVDLEMTYGRFNYDESILDVSKVVKESPSYRLLAKSRGATDTAPLIKVRGFEMMVRPTN
ncbi:MAG: hypothetical protein AB8F74_00780 [Saprospiraceae bacterium]